MIRKAPILRRSELRSRSRLKPSKGTVVPTWMRNEVFARDMAVGGCVGRHKGFPGECRGDLDPDHVRASHGIGMKSPTELWNLVALCRAHHDWKTEHTLEARPKLIDYLEQVQPESVA